MEVSVEAFWERFEQETGEKVIARTMCQRFSAPGDRGDWGLLVLSAASLRFRQTPGENWFASLFKASTLTTPATAAEDMIIPLSMIEEVRRPPRRFLDFLFGSPFMEITIVGAAGSANGLRFGLDPKSELPTRLNELLAAGKQGSA